MPVWPVGPFARRSVGRSGRIQDARSKRQGSLILNCGFWFHKIEKR
ncbi:hypothetical protein D3OALGA1CA_53 [Olavius algarvensis associated proteobacterium Delta 3]|nr:hypothetical protein D3OALGA1CA_53 [Olavius algarvensis associated proteobacterium Delta 3]